MNKDYYPAFKYIDVGRAGQSKWQRIVIDDLEKHRGEFGNIDFCRSVARYADLDPSHEQPMLMGIKIDLDSDVFETVLKEGRLLRNYFYTDWDFKKEEINFSYSGNRSLHIEIQPETLNVKPHDKLHLYIKEIVRAIADKLELKTVDFSLYARRHLLRCVGAQHSKTQRYKIELDPAELDLPPDEIQKLSEANRGSLYAGEDLKLSLNECASRRFYELFNIARNIVDEYSFRGSSIENLGKLKGITKYPVCVNDLLENNIRVNGTRNRATLLLVSFFKDIGKDKSSIVEILTPWAQAISQDLTSANERERINHVIDVAEYVFSDSGNDYHFACPFIRALGDKAHPIACKPRCQLRLNKDDLAEIGDIFPPTVISISYIPEIDGRLVDLIYDPVRGVTLFAVYDPNRDEVIYVDEITNKYPEIYIPYIDENVIKGSVLLPTCAEDYGSDKQLYEEVNKFIAKYYNEPKKNHRVFNTLYVFFTWVYDKFFSCCYGQFLGRAGGGKSRGLEAIGHACYRPIIIAGADSSACMFRMLDRYRGTALIDEATFTDRSEAHSAIVQILNVGYKVGGSVGRCEGDDNRQVRYTVWGPKMLATREDFKDDGLRSRCFVRRTAKDNRIKDGENKQPFILSDDFRDEALKLRNKLLLWRFRHWKDAKINLSLEIKGVESRINEIIVPILSVMNDDSIRKDIEDLAKEQQEDLTQKRQQSVEGEVLKAIQIMVWNGRDINPADIKTEIDKDRPKDKPIKTNYVTRTLKKLELKLHQYANKWWLTGCIENEKLLGELWEDYGFNEKSVEEEAAIADTSENASDNNTAREITYKL